MGALLFFLASCLPSQDATARGRAVLTRALELRGGAAAVRAIRDYVLEMAGRARTRGGGEVTVRTTRRVLFGRPPCLLDRTTWRGGDREFTTEILLKGDKGRQRTPLGARRMTLTEVKRHWAGHHRSTWALLRAALEPQLTVRFVEETKLGERPVAVVEIRRAGEPPLLVDVDRETGFFLRVRWRERPRSGAPPRPFEIRYGAFRTVAGVKGIPFRADAFAGGKRLTSRRTLSLKVNQGLKLEDFPLDSP